MSDKKNNIEKVEEIIGALENGEGTTIEFSQELTIQQIADIENAAKEAGITVTIQTTPT